MSAAISRRREEERFILAPAGSLCHRNTAGRGSGHAGPPVRPSPVPLRGPADFVIIRHRSHNSVCGVTDRRSALRDALVAALAACAAQSPVAMAHPALPDRSILRRTAIHRRVFGVLRTRFGSCWRPIDRPTATDLTGRVRGHRHGGLPVSGPGTQNDSAAGVPGTQRHADRSAARPGGALELNRSGHPARRDSTARCRRRPAAPA